MIATKTVRTGALCAKPKGERGGCANTHPHSNQTQSGKDMRNG